MAGNNSSSWNNQLDFYTCSEDVSCVVKTSVVSLISCLTVVGNLMSLVTLFSTKSLRNCHGYLLISLSLADLFTGLVATTSIYPTIFKKWPHGDLLCFLVASVEASTKKISPLTMTVMSIERYIAVVHPLRYSRIVTKKLVLFSIAIAWCTPIVFYIPLFLKEQIAYKFAFRLSSCTATYIDQVVILLLNTVIFVLSSMVTICVTSCLVWMAFKQNARMRSLLTRKHGGRATQTKRAIKFFRMTRIMCFTFYFCWAPHVTVGIFSILAKKRVPWNVYFALYWLHCSNSFWNVVIYFAMNDIYRRRFLILARSPITVFALLCRRKVDGDQSRENTVSGVTNSSMAVTSSASVNNQKQ